MLAAQMWMSQTHVFGHVSLLLLLLHAHCFSRENEARRARVRPYLKWVDRLQKLGCLSLDFWGVRQRNVRERGGDTSHILIACAFDVLLNV